MKQRSQGWRLQAALPLRTIFINNVACARRNVWLDGLQALPTLPYCAKAVPLQPPLHRIFSDLKDTLQAHTAREVFAPWAIHFLMFSTWKKNLDPGKKVTFFVYKSRALFSKKQETKTKILEAPVLQFFVEALFSKKQETKTKIGGTPVAVFVGALFPKKQETKTKKTKKKLVCLPLLEAPLLQSFCGGTLLQENCVYRNWEAKCSAISVDSVALICSVSASIVESLHPLATSTKVATSSSVEATEQHPLATPPRRASSSMLSLV